jgi:uncharacterized coiled-coil DUF342 family protein
MDLTQLIGEWRTSKKQTESVLRLLREIARLEQNRMQHLPQLRKRLTQLDSFVNQLNRTPHLQDGLRNWLNGYRQELADAAEEFKKRFGIVLEEELTKRGLSLSG